MDNKAADAMATIASLLQVPEKRSCYKFLVEQLFSPAYDATESHVICHLSDTNTYLKDNTLPPNLSWNHKCNLIRRAA